VADLYLKFVVVVDPNEDVNNDHRSAARHRDGDAADRDVFMVPYAIGNTLDPASCGWSKSKANVGATGIEPISLLSRTRS
jgi:3-polyprenyl-4-hydroxybenzoate decarboxylase